MQRILVATAVCLFALTVTAELASARGPRGGGGHAGHSGRSGGKVGNSGRSGGKVGNSGKNGGKVGNGGKNGGKVGNGGKNGGKVGNGGKNGGKVGNGGKNGGKGKPSSRVHHGKFRHHPGRVYRHYHRMDGGGDGDFGDDSAGDAPGVEGTLEEPALYGVLITNLYSGTAARRGLRPGDVIMSFDGTATPTFQDLYTAVQGAGDQAEVVYISQETGREESVILYPENSAIGVSGESVQVE